MKKNVDLSKSVYLQRNENYWDVDEHGNKLPYLEILKFTFMSEKKTEFQAFNKGELDMVWKIPIDELNNVLQDLNDAQGNAQQYLQSADALSIQFYGFLNTHEVFKDIRVRKAFNMAIDREELVRSTLYGEGTPADYGIVPAIDGYPQENIKGFEHNPEEARKLLAEAGYPNGAGFPTIELHINNDGNVNMMLATAIQNQLFENLGVTIEPKQMTLNQLRRKFESGNSALWRTAWVADYPSPENYLTLFHSEHIPDDPSESTFYNAYRYSNPEFDRLYDEAVKTLDDAERMALFAKADQILIDDAVVMPIYYDSYERLMSRKVKNFPINGMEYRDFTRVFINEEE
jgi:peptide/nickel transport system substrate-binding protein